MPTTTVLSVPTSSGSTITMDGSKSYQPKQKCNSKIVTTLALLPNYTLLSIASTQLLGPLLAAVCDFAGTRLLHFIVSSIDL